MRHAKVLVLVMAGGAGGRLGPLTKERAKPAVPYGGIYRLIDFPLSNCLHSGYADVWVIEQFNPFALSDHLANGRPWDLDRTRGGLIVLHPHLGSGHEGWHRGTADAVWRNAALIRGFAADALVILSADAVYRLDYREVVEGHLDADADVTMVTKEIAKEDADRYGVVQVGSGGRIVEYAYKPESPATGLVTNEVFVFRPDRALDLLDEIAEETGEGSDELKDFGDALLPRLVADGGAREHRMEGYWQDVGTLPSYWASHQDLLGDDPRFVLGQLDWPILTHAQQRAPARIARTASLDDALVSPGAVVKGTVERSVLAPGVVVEDGAVVRSSVVLEGTIVRAGAVIEDAVLDEGVEVGTDARVGASSRAGDLQVTVLGKGQRVPPGGKVAPGEQLPDDDE